MFGQKAARIEQLELELKNTVETMAAWKEHALALEEQLEAIGRLLLEEGRQVRFTPTPKGTYALVPMETIGDRHRGKTHGAHR